MRSIVDSFLRYQIEVVLWFCSTGAAEDGRGPTEERMYPIQEPSVRRGRLRVNWLNKVGQC
jgi:hypothetical protein